MSLPSGPLDGLLCAFSTSGDKFAIATPDARVRTYDTVSGRLRSALTVGAGVSKGLADAASGHLAEGQQCLTWVDAQDNAAGPSHSWLAVGTSAGTVQLYDSATGESSWQTTNVNEGGVSCLAYSAGRHRLVVSCGPDGRAVSLDTHSGKVLGALKGSKHGVTAAALSTDGSKLLLGGSTLTVWDVESQQRVCRLTGHPLPVRALCFSPDAAHALSAAVGERLVAVWVVQQQGGKKKAGSVAAASLAVPQPIVQLVSAAAPDTEPPGSFYAAATTEAGEVYVWLVRPQSAAAVDVQQVARLAVDPQHKQQEALLSAALEGGASGATLVVAVGTAAKPRFERVPLGVKAVKSSKITFLQPPPEGEGLIRPAAGSTQPGGTPKAAALPAAAAAAAVLGADNAGQAVQQRQATGSKKRSEPEPDGQEGALDESLANGIDGMDLDDDEQDEELQEEAPLEQRVAQLEAAAEQRGAQDDQRQQQLQDGPAAAAAAAADGGAGAPPGPPVGLLKADSLSVLLSQALRSSDKALLERCLAVGNERVIVNSVKRLVPMDAALLLKAAVERLQSKPSRGRQLAAWIQAVLLHHTAYLMSAPAAAPLMSSLYQVVEARLAMQRQLLTLAGRLDLLLAQRGSAAGAEGAAGAGAGGPVAQVVYQESDSEAEVEVVDAAAAGGEWTDEDADESEYMTDDGEGDLLDDDDDDGEGSSSSEEGSEGDGGEDEEGAESDE